jgi:hypothetical protein
MKTTFAGIWLILLCALPVSVSADEIDPTFEAGYRMGYFMAVATANIDKKVCGNVHARSLAMSVESYFGEYGQKAALKYDKVLEQLSKQFPCGSKGQ